MANLSQPCPAGPFENICCCPPVNGITLTQPACQMLPDGKVVINPCFDSASNKSFWTYKFFTDCAQGTKAISGIAIPVCENIKPEHLVVEEQIDSTVSFTPVPFSLKKTDPNFGTAPAGFQFLKIETSSRYDVGVSVVYRIQVDGDFPEAAQPVKVKAGNQIITFDCDEGCFLVPACPPAGKLQVIKTCKTIIENNKLTLQYLYDITNQGNATLPIVDGTEKIIYDAANINIGTIQVNPSGLKIDTSTPGIIIVTGTVGPLPPGGLINVAINVPVASIVTPGTYLITSNTYAVASGTESSSTCILHVDAVKLSADKCCNVTEGNKGTFRITIGSVGNSPETRVSIVDQIIVPQSVTLQFQDFDGCTAKFGDGSSVPLNTDITNKTINLESSTLTVPKGGSVQKNIKFTVMTTTAFQTPAAIVNTLQAVNFLNTSTQIFLGVSTVPVSSSVNVIGSVQCQKPCSD